MPYICKLTDFQMKKQLLFVIGIFGFLGAIAQCNPNTSYTQPGNYPAALDTAWVDSTYAMTITSVVPQDTSSGIFDVIIDSVIILNTIGLPSGYTTTCNPINCVYLGGSTGCFKIQGTTSNPAAVGSYPLKVVNKIFAHLDNIFETPLTPQVDTLKTYTLHIKKATSTVGIQEQSLDESILVFPNPSDGQFTLGAFVGDERFATILIYDELGRIVLSETTLVSNGKINYTANLLGKNKGLYFIEIRSERKITVGKILIN